MDESWGPDADRREPDEEPLPHEPNPHLIPEDRVHPAEREE